MSFAESLETFSRKLLSEQQVNVGYGRTSGCCNPPNHGSRGRTILVTILVNSEFFLGGLELPLNGFDVDLLGWKPGQAFWVRAGTDLKA